jgi:hypothetical protein
MFDFDVYVSIDSPLAKNYLSLIYIWMVHKNRKDLDYNIFFKKKMEVYYQWEGWNLWDDSNKIISLA